MQQGWFIIGCIANTGIYRMWDLTVWLQTLLVTHKHINGENKYNRIKKWSFWKEKREFEQPLIASRGLLYTLRLCKSVPWEKKIVKDYFWNAEKKTWRLLNHPQPHPVLKLFMGGQK